MTQVVFMYSLCKYNHASTECSLLVIFMNMQTCFRLYGDAAGSDKIVLLYWLNLS